MIYPNNLLFNSILKDHYEKFVENLFNYSSLINIPNKNTETLLHYACFYGMIDKYYALINMGADIKKTNNNNNLLHYATLGGEDDFLILELIKLGISPIDKNIDGQTSVHFSSNERICHYFNLWCMRNKIKVEQILDNRGNTVAHYAFCIDKKAATYWIKHYEKLKFIKNVDNLLFSEINQYMPQFCKI